MKKLIAAIVIIIIILCLLVVLGSYLSTNSMIKENDFNRYPQFLSSKMWKIRDALFDCPTEIKLVRDMIYSTEPLLNGDIEHDIKMPDLSGISGIDAIYTLENCGYDVDINFVQAGKYRENRVVSHHPNVDAVVEPGDTIEVILQDSRGISNVNSFNGGEVAVHGKDIYYYDNDNDRIIKTDYELTHKDIIFEGSVKKISAIGEYLYFYSYPDDALLGYNFETGETEVIIDSGMWDYRIWGGCFYFLDDTFNLKRMAIGTGEIEKIGDDKIVYFQIENDMIYYNNFPKPKEDMQMNVLSMDLNGNNKKVMIESVWSFFVKDEFVYYSTINRESVYLRHSGLYKLNLNSGSKKIISLDRTILSFAFEDEYKFLTQASSKITDNRTIKGVFGLINTSDDYKHYYRCYSVGKRVFLQLDWNKNNWDIYDGNELYEFD